MNNKYRILVIEDDRNIQRMLCSLLESAGFQVVQAVSGAAALTMIGSHVPDLIVLDLGLPDMDGTHILSALRQSDLTPVIVLSARAGEEDKVDAFDRGANDYITKPFSAAEFLARVRSALRFGRHRAESGRLSGGKFQVRDLTIEYDARRVFIGNTEIKLTQTEFNILAYLSESSGKVLTYAAIIKAIWGTDTDGSIKKLQVNMANIRKKLGAVPGADNYIVNELGVGYRMNRD